MNQCFSLAVYDVSVLINKLPGNGAFRILGREFLSNDSCSGFRVFHLISADIGLYITREHSKKFKEEDMQVHMEGKNCMVTGANSGIGYATVEGLASR